MPQAMNDIAKPMPRGFYAEVKQILTDARSHAYRAVNTAMVQAYWHVGKLIVEAQGGEERAAYGEALIKELSVRLTSDFGKGFTTTNLKNMRTFYLTFPKGQTLSDQLSWSHYCLLMRVSNPKAREYYAEEAAKTPWSVRQLERQISTQYYERLLAHHKDEVEVKELIQENRPAKPEKFNPLKLIHDPFVLEFLGVKDDPALQEKDLEAAIISHMSEFLLELGRGFAFVGRQRRITIDGTHFYPDLVFYNIISKCYVIIDLKMGKAGYAEVGQMQLYVNYYNAEICTDTDNPTVGIVLCANKNDAEVKYTLGDRNDIGVFSPNYHLTIPTEEELRREIAITRENFKLLHPEAE